MPLSSEQQQKVQAWLNSKGIKVACPCCGHNNWSLGEIISSPIMTQGGMQIGGPSVPAVQVVCNNCAYINHFAAVPMGLP